MDPKENDRDLHVKIRFKLPFSCLNLSLFFFTFQRIYCNHFLKKEPKIPNQRTKRKGKKILKNFWVLLASKRSRYLANYNYKIKSSFSSIFWELRGETQNIYVLFAKKE